MKFFTNLKGLGEISISANKLTAFDEAIEKEKKFVWGISCF